ncbi:MAG: hypothetical protein R2880_04255 [Deinococcales bacterium]
MVVNSSHQTEYRGVLSLPSMMIPAVLTIKSQDASHDEFVLSLNLDTGSYVMAGQCSLSEDGYACSGVEWSTLDRVIIRGDFNQQQLNYSASFSLYGSEDAIPDIIGTLEVNSSLKRLQPTVKGGPSFF